MRRARWVKGEVWDSKLPSPRIDQPSIARAQAITVEGTRAPKPLHWMLNEAIRDEGDILITRLGRLQRGPNFKWMWKFNYVEREQDTWHHGADYLEAWGEGKGCQRIKQRRKGKSHDQEIHKTAGKCNRSITSWGVGWTSLSRESGQISPTSNFRNSLFSFL